MDIFEATSLRVGLEEQIMILLNEFQNRTGLQIDEIYLTKVREVAVRHELVHSVSVKVSLP